MPTYSIQVFYTPQITSTSEDSPFICHRICYRKQGDVAYCCFEDDTDSYAGTPKTFTFEVGDDPCSPHIEGVENPLEINAYEGYVQPCCDVNGTMKIPWTATFFPV